MSNLDNTTNYEMDWNDEIQNDTTPYHILPEGDYDFRVEKFERARHSGSGKIPACNKAILTLSVSASQERGTILTNLFLYRQMEWKLCQFFTAIGARKRGETLRMNWSAVTGATGRCHVGIRKWTGIDGKEREANEVTEFYEPEDLPTQWQSGYTAGQF